MVFLKEDVENVDVEKDQQTTNKHAKLSSVQKVKKDALDILLSRHFSRETSGSQAQHSEHIHVKARHHGPTLETPFKWHFAAGWLWYMVQVARLPCGTLLFYRHNILAPSTRPDIPSTRLEGY